MTPRFRCVWIGIVALVVFGAAGSRMGAQSPAPTPAPSPVNPLLDGNALNDVWVHINARDWQELHTRYLENTYYPVDFEWQGNNIRNSGIRVRGNTTRNDGKPSFRIDFNRYVDGQDLFGLKAVVLNNMIHDPSSVHDRLSMLLLRTIGLPAPRQAHVRLFVGAARQYAGLYAISEEVSKSFLTDHFGGDGGHLYEFHHQTDELYGFQDPGSDLNWFARRFEPKTHENDSVASLYMPMRDLVTAINDARPAELDEKLSDFFDLDSFITMLAVQNYLAQTDGIVGGVGMNNFYLFRFPNRRFWMMIPWDQDNSFSRLDMPPIEGMLTNVLTTKIWNEPKYRRRYLNRLIDVANLAGQGSFAAEAVRVYEQIREASYTDPIPLYSREDFEKDNAFVQRFTRERPAFVRQAAASVMPD